MSVTNLKNTAPAFEMVSVDTLTIDSRVQRQEGVDIRRAQKMADAYDRSAVGTITVSRRPGGTLVIIDGAHRTEASRIAGVPQIPALIYVGLSLAQEAALFVELNNFKAPSLLSRMLASRVAGDKAAKAILDTIENHGWKIDYSSDAGHFAAVNAAERVYRNGVGALAPGEHQALLDRTMNLITAAWRHDRESAHSMVVQGVGLLLARFGDGIDSASFALALAQHRPYVLIGKAKALHSAQGGTTSSAFAKALVGIYNTRRRNGRLPEWVWTR